MKQQGIDLRNFLMAQPAVTAILGAGAACKIFPMVANEGTLPPYLTYAMRSSPFTKDARQESATVVLWYAYGKYTEMTGFADTVVALLEQEYDVGEVYPDYNEEFGMYATIIEIEI